MGTNIVAYDFIKDLATQTNSNTVHIDVREPKELQETGTYPHSINIPLAVLEKTLKDLSDDEFKAKYGKTKPGVDNPIVVSCKMGGRSAKAQVLLRELGYKKVYNYSGGWMDWEKNQKQ